MGGVIQPIQLLLFPLADITKITLLTTNYAILGRRSDFVKKYLIYWEWSESGEEFTHPDYKKVFELLDEYVVSASEDSKMYDKIKTMLTLMLGAVWFDFILSETYFFHRNEWLQKNNIDKLLKEDLE